MIIRLRVELPLDQCRAIAWRHNDDRRRVALMMKPADREHCKRFLEAAMGEALVSCMSEYWQGRKHWKVKKELVR